MRNIVAWILGIAMGLVGAGVVPAMRGPDAAARQNYVLDILNDSGQDISELRVEYSMDGVHSDGWSQLNADGSPVAAGERMTVIFTPDAFPAGEDAARLELDMFVTPVTGGEVRTGETLTLDAAFGVREALAIRRVDGALCLVREGEGE